MHIITGLNQGGAENVLCRVIESRHVVCDFHVVSMMDDGDYGAKLRSLGVTVSTLGMKRGMASVGAFFKLRGIIREWKPDVVQTWMYHADLLGGVAAKTAGVRRIAWGIRHSSLDRRLDSGRTIFIARLNALLSYIVPDVIISCSMRAAEMHKRIGYKSGIISVIPNGYPLDRFKPDKSLAVSFRKQFDIAPRTVVYGNASRFDPQKDHVGLIKAFGMLKRSRPYSDILLLLCGRNVDENNAVLRAAIRRDSLENFVKLIGKQSDMPGFMNALDHFVLSSRHGEAFPNVLAEAMACGKPCISTDVGDAADIIGDTGWIVPPSMPDMLAGAMLEALRENGDSLARRKLSARDRVVSHYDIESIAEMYMNVWKNS